MLLVFQPTNLLYGSDSLLSLTSADSCLQQTISDKPIVLVPAQDQTAERQSRRLAGEEGWTAGS